MVVGQRISKKSVQYKQQSRGSTMFQAKRTPKSTFGSVISMFEVIYHSIVRSVRSQHSNAFIAIGINMMQAVMFVAAFYAMFSIMGLKGAGIRGDFLLYIMSGIFMYLTHIKTLAAILSAEGPTSAMMQHAPMTSAISIASAALSSLYIQTLSLVLILFIYHMVWNPIVIHDPISSYGMFLLAWFSGACVGLVLLSLKPWFPAFVQMAQMIYQRANMIASGKMFVANVLPAHMLALFDWNPLFHIIDQARGFAFQNYYPRNSDWEYAFWISCVFLVFGMMGEFYARKNASLSWEAKR
jgi:ABC-type polysaccharide/polyol phosphate export permease